MGNLNSIVNDLAAGVFSSLKRNRFTSLGMPEKAIWEQPLMGVAAGDDPYYDFLKDHIGAFHWSPAEAFALKYGEAPEASKLRVLSFVFPQTDETKELQSKENKIPCAAWAVARGEWIPLVKEFSEAMEATFEKEGIRAVAIDLRKELTWMMSEKQGRSSTWSHRHSAFAAGLGTFGLSDGFISERGMAVRLTSIVVEADLEITPRGDRGHYDWCLYFKSGICGACIRRCPVRAIGEKGHDKTRCGDYMKQCDAHWRPKLEGSAAYDEVGCGLCQTKVPCMSKRP